MTTHQSLYQRVYDLTRREADDPSCLAVQQHKDFARRLPPPGSTSPDDEAALCALVRSSGEWGLEGFFNCIDKDSGMKLGVLVEQELPNWRDYDARAHELAERYRP